MSEVFCDTGKISYESEKEANAHVKGLSQRNKGRHKFSVYKCKECGKFHVTTATKKRLRHPKIGKYPLHYSVNRDVIEKCLNGKKTKKKK